MLRSSRGPVLPCARDGADSRIDRSATNSATHAGRDFVRAEFPTDDC